MRIWHGIAPIELDNKRLFAAHREFHAIYRKILKGRRWQGWEEPKHVEALWLYHESIIEELHERQYDIHCNFPCPEFNAWIQKPYIINKELQTECRWILICRWQGEYKGRGETPSWAESMVRKYHEVGGCQHNLSVALIENRTQELCMCCKRYARIRGGSEWFEIPYIGYLSKAK